MKLTVVMAVRNGEPYIREAIDSVLAQSVVDFELLVVDDASTDTTREIIASYQRQDARVRLLCNDTNLGPYPSTNRGLEAARGEFVARHDADDVSTPDRFAIQLAALRTDDTVVLVTGAVEAFDARGDVFIVRPPRWQPRLEWELLFSNVVGAGAHVMFPRLFHGRPVTFPAQRRYAEDYGMWCRLAQLGRVVCPPEVVYRYRQHESSITSSRKVEQEECFTAQRHEYQALYSDRIGADEGADLAHFWVARRASHLSRDLPGLGTTLRGVRAGFLDYVARRYGPDDRAMLDRDIDDALVERFTQWLTRAIREGDVRSSRGLLALSGTIGLRRRVTERLAGRIAQAAKRTLSRRAVRAKQPVT